MLTETESVESVVGTVVIVVGTVVIVVVGTVIGIVLLLMLVDII